MSATIQAADPVSSSTEIRERVLLAGLGLTSFAALLLELSLTRLFSVVLFYHFAFLLKRRLARLDTRTLAARLCLANSLLILLVLEIVLHVPVALSVTGRNFLHLTVLYLAASTPFFLTGLLFSVVFARETWRVQRLYGADLSGGALACLAVVPLLNWIGGPNTIVAAAGAMALAAVMWANSSSARRIAGGLVAAFAVLIAANHSDRLIDVIYAKGIFRDPAWVEFARWNALSRVEVDRQDEAKAIVID